MAFPHVLRDGSVTPGQHASFLGKEYDPFFVGQDPNRRSFRLPELSLPERLPLDRLDDRRGLQKLIDSQTDLLDWSETARGIDAFYEPRPDDARLAPRSSGRSICRRSPNDSAMNTVGRRTARAACLARRLLEAGVRFVSVYFSASIGGASGGGWDTHGDNFNRLKNRLLPMTDQTVPTLIRDLSARGLLDETLIVWMGEFGRSPRVTNTKQFGADGRDHWPNCYTVLMAGGGIAPGAIHGASDRIGAYPSIDAVTPDDVAATMFWALGIDPATEVRDTLGRPLPIAAGRPITRIFS